MKALVLENLRDLQLRDVPEPELGSNDVLIQVKACGICGSDVHGYDGSTGRRIPPIIMGHEAAGTVVRVGPEVRTVGVGDRVTFDSTVSCGTCSFCRTGDVNLCYSRQVLGVSCGDYRRNGAFAEYVAVPAHIVYRNGERVLLTDPHDIKDPLSDALIALSARVEELEQRLGAEPCPPDPFAAEEAERAAYRVELERLRVYVTMGEGI